MRDGRSFVRILEEAADDGIGVSSLQILVRSVRRGGQNYAHLETPEKIRRVFERDFDLMVTPLAYDLEISLWRRPAMRSRRMGWRVLEQGVVMVSQPGAASV